MLRHRLRQVRVRTTPDRRATQGAFILVRESLPEGTGGVGHGPLQVADGLTDLSRAEDEIEAFGGRYDRSCV